MQMLKLYVNTIQKKYRMNNDRKREIATTMEIHKRVKIIDENTLIPRLKKRLKTRLFKKNKKPLNLLIKSVVDRLAKLFKRNEKLLQFNYFLSVLYCA